MSDVLPRLVAPSETEARGYYYGVPSMPRLLGRTSAGIVRWEHPVYYDEDTIDIGFPTEVAQRILSPVGEHKLHSLHEAILPKIISALDLVPWTSIDTVRIGYNTIPVNERPVVVWVGVRDAGLPWPIVAESLRIIRSVLDAAGLQDVECEMREAQVFRLGGPPLLEPRGTRDAEKEQAVSTSVGQSVSPVENQFIEGTLGVYLCSARTENPTVWGLTCRHVALPTKLHTNDTYDQRRNQPGLEMALPSRSARENLIRTISSEMNEIDSRIRLGDSDDIDLRNLAHLKEFRRFLDDIGPVDQRTFGRVCFAPPIGPATGEHPWARDWALIALDKNKVLPQRTRNVVDLRSQKRSVSELPAFLSQHDGSKFALKPSGVFLPLVGTVPVAELRQISRGDPKERFPVADERKYGHGTIDGHSTKRERPMFNSYGNRCLVVGKRGGATGLTWCVSNDFESVLRTFDEEDGIPTFMSRAWAMFGTVGSSTTPFSQKGDSGSAIFDVTGRVMGLLVAGSCRVQEKIDVTYATPMEWVLKDVSNELGEPVRLL